MGRVILQSDLPKTTPNYVGKHPKDMDKFEYNQMMKDAITGKLNDYPEQKKTFLQFLEEQLNNIGNGVQIEAEHQTPVTEFKPSIDLINVLQQPFTKHCEMCGRTISAGRYCDDCAKEMVKKNYV